MTFAEIRERTLIVALIIAPTQKQTNKKFDGDAMLNSDIFPRKGFLQLRRGIYYARTAFPKILLLHDPVPKLGFFKGGKHGFWHPPSLFRKVNLQKKFC